MAPIALTPPSQEHLLNAVEAERLQDAFASAGKTLAPGLHYDDAGVGGGSSLGEDDPVCIVGMSCRLPGGVRSPSDLWDLLVQKKTGKCRVPKERFNIDAFYHPESERAGSIDCDGGYFIQEDVRQFENTFFGLNNLEATYMDPQQRKLLEVVYEAFESAGKTLDDVNDANIGVYVGNFTVDFSTMQSREPDYMHRYHATGMGTAILSNRVSHVFNLHGPSFTLDTACSSSIYCLHNAVCAIANGECDAAVVAGCNLVTSPEQHIGTGRAGVLSATSTCHTFDVSADGYGRAEGVSALFVKRLSSALRDGDNIRAVIRGTAINSNGKTPGITQPSSKFQEAVIRKAYRKAGLDFQETDYVETHGTGTAVGDPVEVEGIGRSFARKEGPPLLLGAVKTNLGHSEAASGNSSVIKAILALEHGEIPPTYGITKLNPSLNLEKWNMKVITESKKWPSRIRRASINSFGYGGANAHAILESIDSYLPSWRAQRSAQPLAKTGKMYVLPFSAQSKTSLEARISDIHKQAYVRGIQHDLSNLSFTLANHRTHLRQRGYLLANPETSLRDIAPQHLIVSPAGAKKLPLAFIFTGQGAQYAGMATELLHTCSTFRTTILHLDSVLAALPDEHAPSWTLEQMLRDPTANASYSINDATRSQPVCTAVQVAIVDVLRGWGISPQAAVGHSSGEIAAAYAAGLLSAAQAIVIAYYRGVAAGETTTSGAMLAAGIGADEAEDLMREKRLQGKVVVACVNSPQSVTVSGAAEGIEAVLAELQSRKKFARKLQTGGRAYHSHLIKEIGPLYEQLMQNRLSGVPSPTPDGDVKMFSSVGVRGQALQVFTADTTRYLEPGYWRANLENSVQFSMAIQNMNSTGKYHLIEIGPHSALKGPLNQIRTSLGLAETDLPYTSTLLRNEDADRCLKHLAGTLFLHGHSLDFSKVNVYDLASVTSIAADLPPYRWDYTQQLLWHEPRSSVELRNRQFMRHELLGVQQVAGSGLAHGWRNLLRLNEVPWMRDHRLETQVVFPAAGYLATAIEALCQFKGLHAKQVLPGSAFEFRDVNILAAFVVNEDSNIDAEVHTSMHPRRLSTASVSDLWFDFSISSWVAGESTQHCVGSIRFDTPTQSAAGAASVTLDDNSDFERQSMGPWYQQLAATGLRFGPSFQTISSLRTPRDRSTPTSVTTTTLLQRVKLAPDSTHPGTFYPTHPLVIDACLQATLFGSPAGNLNRLRAHLPVFFERCRIVTPTSTAVDGEASIHSRTMADGFGALTVAATMRDQAGAVVVDMSGVRLALYSGMSAAADKGDSDHGGSGVDLERNPCLRVAWKPDLLRVDEAGLPQLEAYLARFVEQRRDILSEHAASVGVVAGILDLLGHRNPKMRVVELGGVWCDCKRGLWLDDVLDKRSSFPRCRVWHRAQVDESYTAIRGADGQGLNGPYDVLLLPEANGTDKLWNKCPAALMDLVADQGVVIGRKPNVVAEVLSDAGFKIFELPNGVMLALPWLNTKQFEDRDIFLVGSPSASAAFVEALKWSLGSRVKHLSLADLGGIDIPTNAVVVSLLELEKPFLATMSPDDMDLFRHFTNTVSDVVWLTGAGMLEGENPDLTLASGLSRATMLEQPSLRFALLDVGKLDEKRLFDAECTAVQKVLATFDEMDDKEFIHHDGLLHISRFVPDHGLNTLFRRRTHESAVPTLLEEAGPAKLSIQKVGLMDTICFQELSELPTAPPAGFVDIETKAASLNAKDVYALAGKVQTKNGTSGLEFAGVVKAIGSGVDCLQPGDRVVVLAPNYMSPIERVPAWACQKMLPEEDFTVMSTLGLVYATALYALHDRANLRKGESILIHSGAGAFGTAAITIAQRIGAIVYTTVSTEEKASMLVREMGLKHEHIFHSRDASFVAKIHAATGGRGVDVLVNSLVGDLMHSSWECMANFGRFIEVGKRELVDAGRLDLSMFQRNATFTAFDLTELFWHEDQFYRDIWISKFRETLALYRAGEIKPAAIATYDVSDVAQAYRHFSSRDRMGKIVISFENLKSTIPLVPAQHASTFSPEKSYLLIGCLGGLGRSLSGWMLRRGARHFTFLGRSGTDKPSAQELITQLSSAGATVTVIRGDVVDAGAVQAAVDACTHPIGGVVQAAMGLHEALFATMPHAAWHTGVQPKWRGTWNLHHALEKHAASLDFFLMTSSVSGSVGTATESNYCAANGFLDAFARWRRAQGKPAVAVGLGMVSEVGYLHENPEIEALLLRKGIQPLDEREFLQVVDMALADAARVKPRWCTDGSVGKELVEGHILTGLEPFGLRDLMRRGFDVDNGTMQDPRSRLLAASLEASMEDRATDESGIAAASTAAVAAWATGLQPTIAKALAAEADAGSLEAAVHRLVHKRFSNLILIPIDTIDDQRPLAQYGMDSMIAAEFRTWFWSVFKVDVPFLDILSQTNSLSGLGKFVERRLKEGIQA
ncbi:Highly reducing polyketide synthase easB [Lasiodiplodia theobromae]|uniref:Highly reducing polyketide synthase easB n=1 Tax=Lasiodiplodia theobromae TaxID=45133 RepID=A0A5N5D1P5_9PEZI|nr:Highly reducing polyketide synthase easB [Lasiodiplodia theobromae]